MKKYYVYRITNKNLDKHYYGYRSIPIDKIEHEDLGIAYFSSSKDKKFIKLQKESPEIFKYKILYKTPHKSKALNLEIQLHKRFDVGKNEKFYNNAKQTSTKFSYNKPQKRKEKYRMMKNDMGEVVRLNVKDGDNFNGLVGMTKGSFKVMKNGRTFLVEAEDYDPNTMTPTNTGKIVAINLKSNKKVLISKSEFENNPDVYRGHSLGMVTMILKSTGETIYINKSDVDDSIHTHHNKGKKHTKELKNKLSKMRLGFMTVKNIDGHVTRMHKEDPRYLSGEYQTNFARIHDLTIGSDVIKILGNRTNLLKYFPNLPPKEMSKIKNQIVTHGEYRCDDFKISLSQN